VNVKLSEQHVSKQQRLALVEPLGSPGGPVQGGRKWGGGGNGWGINADCTVHCELEAGGSLLVLFTESVKQILNTQGNLFFCLHNCFHFNILIRYFKALNTSAHVTHLVPIIQSLFYRVHIVQRDNKLIIDTYVCLIDQNVFLRIIKKALYFEFCSCQGFTFP